jgi:hypothetical protein
MGKTENSNINFNAAIQLLNEIEAPKQIEKLKLRYLVKRTSLQNATFKKIPNMVK